MVMLLLLLHWNLPVLCPSLSSQRVSMVLRSLHNGGMHEHRASVHCGSRMRHYRAHHGQVAITVGLTSTWLLCHILHVCWWLRIHNRRARRWVWHRLSRIGRGHRSHHITMVLSHPHRLTVERCVAIDRHSAWDWAGCQRMRIHEVRRRRMVHHRRGVGITWPHIV